jgi:hypothetical protein
MILTPFSCLASPSPDVGHTSCGCYWVAESFYTLFWSNYASHIVGQTLLECGRSLLMGVRGPVCSWGGLTTFEKEKMHISARNQA